MTKFEIWGINAQALYATKNALYGISEIMELGKELEIIVSSH